MKSKKVIKLWPAVSLAMICVSVGLFLNPCRNDSIRVANFATKAEIIETGQKECTFQFTISNPLPYAVEFHSTGFKVQSIEFARICTSEGKLMRVCNHDENATIPTGLTLPAHSTVSFACKLLLSQNEQDAFRSGKIRFEYPVLSYSIDNVRYDALPWEWIPFSSRPRETIQQQCRDVQGKGIENAEMSFTEP